MNLLSKLRLAMKEKEIDAVLVLDELNQRYLSNFAFTDGYLLITHTNAYLVTDFRYYEMAENYEKRICKNEFTWREILYQKGYNIRNDFF